MPGPAGILMLAVLVAQAGPSSFAGTWTAEFRGDAYVRLELRESGGVLAGRISLGAVHVDRTGTVDEVRSPAVNFTPIFDVALRAGTLTFARKDGDDTDRFEMRLTETGAQLAFVPSAEDRATLERDGVPLPKPVGLTRVPR